MEKHLSLEETILSKFSPPLLSSITRIKMEPKEINAIISEFRERQGSFSRHKGQFIDYFKKSEENFNSFVEHLADCWKSYTNLVYYLDSINDNPSYLFMDKLNVIEELASTLYALNENIYFMTDIEKEVYEEMISRLPEDRAIELVSSVKSFPTHIAKIGFENPDMLSNKNYLRKLLLQNPSVSNLFGFCGNSLELLSKSLKNNGNANAKTADEEFVPENEFERNLKEILAYDHFMELFFRKSGMLTLDAGFYASFCKRNNKEASFANVLEIIKNKKEIVKNKFKFDIPAYKQNYMSCGVTCMMNALSAFGAGLTLDRKTENELYKKVTVEGYPNNLAPDIIKISREDYGIPAKFIVDMKTFSKAFIESDEHDFPPLRRFLKNMPSVPQKDISGLTKEYVVDTLQNGSMIAYVCDCGDFLHYKLIYGYDRSKEQKSFYVFDPSFGSYRMPMDDVAEKTRNRYSFWAIEYAAPETILFDSVRDEIKRAKNQLDWIDRIKKQQ